MGESSIWYSRTRKINARTISLQSGCLDAVSQTYHITSDFGIRDQGGRSSFHTREYNNDRNRQPPAFQRPGAGSQNLVAGSPHTTLYPVTDNGRAVLLPHNNADTDRSFLLLLKVIEGPEDPAIDRASSGSYGLKDLRSPKSPQRLHTSVALMGEILTSRRSE